MKIEYFTFNGKRKIFENFFVPFFGPEIEFYP